MDWYHIAYIIIVFLTIPVFLFLAVYSFTHRSLAGAYSFGWLSVMGCWGSLMDMLSFLLGDPFIAHILYNARYLTFAFFPVFWADFAIRYTGSGLRLRRSLLFILPVITQVMIWTNPLHGLWVVRDSAAVRTGPFILMDAAARIPAPWFLIHTAYGYALLLLGVMLIIRMSLGMIRIYRRQAVALGAGTIILLAGSAVPIFGLIPGLPVNPLPQMLALSGLIFAWAIFRYRLLDLVPVARGLVLESIDDAIIVLDSGNRVLDLNPAMRNILAEGFRTAGRTLPGALAGMQAAELFAPWRDLALGFRGVTDVKTEVSSTVTGAERHYDLHITPLPERQGSSIGRVVVLRDITDRNRAEVALREKNWELGERMKELNCLFSISEIVRRPGITLDEILGETAALIPAAWLYPDITCARLTLNGQVFRSVRCGESPWRLASDIMVNGVARGSVEVFYLEEREPRDEGPFLKEERALVDAIAERLGRVVERQWAENDLKLSEARLDALHTLNNKKFSDENELIHYALEEEVRLTGSEIGYFHFVKEDGVSLELFAWSSRVMETCTAAADRHYPLNLAGVWADCARTGRPAVHNDYAGLADRKGMPEGHSPIIRHVSVPVFDGDRVAAISGVANKPGPYNAPDIRQMQLFMDGVWKIVMRKRAEEALVRALEEKQGILEELEASEAALRDRNEKMEFDLMIAQSAQKAIVRAFKPECRGLTVEYRYSPMEKVGGDYFSFFQPDDASLGFFIGDVSGHGISAALFIALLKSVTDRAYAELGERPDAYLRMVNDELVDYISSNFITAVYGIFSPGDEKGTMRLRYSNGAHVKPIVMPAGGGCFFHGVASTIMGVSGGIEFEVNELTLKPGDRLFLVTDGIPETVNQKKEMIGFDKGLLGMFLRCRQNRLRDTLDSVIEETARHRNGLPPQDDITIIGFEVPE